MGEILRFSVIGTAGQASNETSAFNSSRLLPGRGPLGYRSAVRSKQAARDRGQ